MASPYERPDGPALARVEVLLQQLSSELTTWRRRALKAEGELNEVKGQGGMGGADIQQLRSRTVGLETENLTMQSRIGEALRHVESLQARLRFLEHQEEGAAR